MDVKFKTVGEYFSSLPEKHKKLLLDLRAAIKQAAPQAEEVISYNMPAFKLNGILVYCAAHKEHVGFYPGSGAVTGKFKDKLSGYKTSKGTIQFPLDKPIPKQLVREIVKYRVIQNLEKMKKKS